MKRVSVKIFSIILALSMVVSLTTTVFAQSVLADEEQLSVSQDSANYIMGSTSAAFAIGVSNPVEANLLQWQLFYDAAKNQTNQYRLKDNILIHKDGATISSGTIEIPHVNVTTGATSTTTFQVGQCESLDLAKFVFESLGAMSFNPEGGAVKYNISFSDGTTFISEFELAYEQDVYRDGSEENPFAVFSSGDFEYMKGSYANKRFELLDDLNFGIWTTLNIDFSGYLDGNGHTITIESIRPLISSGYYYGVFKYISGTVKNINFEVGSITEPSYHISNSNHYVGVIAASTSISSKNPIHLENIHINSGEIKISASGTVYAGGLIGTVGGYGGVVTVDRCFSHVVISGTLTGSGSSFFAGGLTGSTAAEMTISNSGNYAKIEGTSNSMSNIGGLVGQVFGPLKISESVNYGEVYASGNLTVAGGLVGYHTFYETRIVDSYNTARVSAKAAGGLVGKSTSYTTVFALAIRNSYNMGVVRSSDTNTGGAGGIIGRVETSHQESSVHLNNNFNTYSQEAPYGTLVGNVITSYAFYPLVFSDNAIFSGQQPAVGQYGSVCWDGNNLSIPSLTKEVVFQNLNWDDAVWVWVEELQRPILRNNPETDFDNGHHDTTIFTDYFPDANLAQAVAETFGRDSSDTVTPAELEAVLSLNASNKGIYSIEGIGYLTGLTELRLSGNNIAVIPAEIGNLTGLTLLGIANNQLTDLPEELWTLTNITTLGIDVNPLGKIADGISNLSALDALYANNINLIEPLPTSLFSIPNSVLSNQASTLPPVTTDAATLTYTNLLPPVVEQLARYNNGNLIGEWIITKPNGTTVTIPAGNGSEITPSLFNQTGQYSVIYTTEGAFYLAGSAQIGSLRYTTQVTIEGSNTDPIPDGNYIGTGRGILHTMFGQASIECTNITASVTARVTTLSFRLGDQDINLRAAIYSYDIDTGVSTYRAVVDDITWTIQIAGNGETHVVGDYGDNPFISKVEIFMQLTTQ